jgi:archaellum biogenesis protein FlaJ (TadC family)
MFRKYKSYEIQLSAIYDYEIKKAFFNRLVFIRILVKKNNQVGNYPWLSLSALPNKDFKKLTETLDKLVSIEKRKNK